METGAVVDGDEIERERKKGKEKEREREDGSERKTGR